MPPQEVRIITCEEHSVIGGLGEAACSLLEREMAHPCQTHRRHDEFALGPTGRCRTASFNTRKQFKNLLFCQKHQHFRYSPSSHLIRFKFTKGGLQNGR